MVVANSNIQNTRQYITNQIGSHGQRWQMDMTSRCDKTLGSLHVELHESVCGQFHFCGSSTVDGWYCHICCLSCASRMMP